MKYLLLLLLISFVIPVYSQEAIYSGRDFFIIQNILGEYEEYETPYFIYRSEYEYPKILIDACIHGDEIAGAMACDTVMKYIDVMKGTVVFIPRVNIKAYNTGVRGVNVDLNQFFPGRKDSVSFYEQSLAYDFMKVVEDNKPDVVINLHEAWTKYDDNKYHKQNDKSFGQTLITNYENPPAFLTEALEKINSKINIQDHKFRTQYFPYKSNHSMDNIIEKLKIPSFTVETLRTLPINDRINYQIICILSFIKQAGIRFKYSH
jgi:hypothetical protein